MQTTKAHTHTRGFLYIEAHSNTRAREAHARQKNMTRRASPFFLIIMIRNKLALAKAELDKLIAAQEDPHEVLKKNNESKYIFKLCF